MSSLPEYQRKAVANVRSLFAGRPSSTITARQNRSLADSETDVPPWACKATIPAPPDTAGTLLEPVTTAIQNFGDGRESYTKPSVEDVEVTWTFPHEDAQALHPDAENASAGAERYKLLMEKVKNDVTILYFHGGGFYMNSPARYQSVVNQLANLSPAVCVCPRYRLAPQHPFPAPLVDALLCYLSLLYPPPGSFHSPIEASKIVFAGDSAGANIALSLLQIIHSARTSKLNFHGHSRELPLPGGVATLSPGLDTTLALPSWKTFHRYDVFAETWSFLAPDQPTCALWPANPPRALPFCETSTMCHPLVAPATQKDWSWAPPMWFACGQEKFADSAKAVAETAARQKVNVRYEEYEEMPHVFPIWETFAPALSTADWPQSRVVMANWAEACRRFGSGQLVARGADIILTEGGTKPLDLENLTGLDYDQRLSLMEEKKASWKVFTGPEDST